MNKNFFYKLLLLVAILFIISGCATRERGAVVKFGEKEGFLLDSGDLSVKTKYDRIYRFDDDLHRYSHKNYVNLHWVHNDGNEAYAIVKNYKDRFGIIDKNGKPLIKVMYDSIGYFKNGFAKVELNKKFGLINRDFEIILKPKYDEIEEFTHNTAVFKANGKYGCINKDMEVVIKPVFDRIYLEYEGMRRLEFNKKWGFADLDCNIVAKAKFDFASNFFNGYAKVKQAKRWGFVDKSGKYVSKERFDKIENFK